MLAAGFLRKVNMDRILFSLFSWFMTRVVARDSQCRSSPRHSVRKNTSHEYCIIGGGPGGLQLASLMEEDGRDYVVLEKNPTAGSTFKFYPRHRKLISINKRYTGNADTIFQERHDWNSLLSNDERLKFSRYSEEYWPHADELVTYLEDFARLRCLHVAYNTTVLEINTSQGGDFRLNISVAQFEADPVTDLLNCQVVVVATGLEFAPPEDLHGVELAETYDSVSTTASEFANLTVMVFGAGNAAFETVSHLHQYAAKVEVKPRSHIRFAWDTHYPGDVRANSMELLES